jgi:AcrR family transcriptional regulator
MTMARTARERVHQEMTGEILATARAHLARDGAAALSLRSIARDLGLAPSALYRYFSGRDALLSALILSAYEALADEAERASAAYAGAGADSDRFLGVPRAVRAWARSHPNEWSLIFGTPVPGYHAPQDTVVPYIRLAGALVRPVAEAAATGRLSLDDDRAVLVAGLGDAVAPVTAGLLPGLSVPAVVAALQAWTMLIGVISLELFGHWNKTVLDPDLFFEQTMRDLARSLGLT